MLGDDDGGPPLVVLVVAGLLVGVAAAPVAVGVTDRGTSTVAVIPVEGSIDGGSAAALSAQIERARADPSVEAVVLLVNSPGGAASASETQYLAVKRLAEEKPVVASVDGIAASGAYYTIAPADAIYVKPSSLVGSVGVVATLPSRIEQQNEIVQSVLRTGPDKQLRTVDDVREELDLLQNAFVGSVMKHRGDELTLSEEEVSNAATYRGTEAVQNGFADRVGTLESAIQRAAEESEGIEGDQYDIHYKAPPRTGLALLFSEGTVETRNGSIVYVDRSEDTGTNTEFVQPVEFYAVYGVPVDGSTEVTTNETD